jgi:chloramphenicol 3-O phosphotransferase
LGEAEYHLKYVHTYSSYDFELDTSEHPLEESAKLVLSAWGSRSETKFFG